MMTRVRTRPDNQVGLTLGLAEHVMSVEEAQRVLSGLMDVVSVSPSRTRGDETALALVKAQCAFELAQAKRIEAWRAEKAACERLEATKAAREEWERGQLMMAGKGGVNG